ncbi:hypothetical protein J4573_46735 [Actinomadura barringtoniae]|uniref:Uncharacterized protein n=1 Tax=Actinomadura barringtoniae TaxID=1427535 RepID=A0A939PLS4_9ACTN|nr:hypothetical protein [Actinomadura barringtoniae]MBO2454655.1 hypothetical protein [Actinomadura barringtoniae]
MTRRGTTVLTLLLTAALLMIIGLCPLRADTAAGTHHGPGGGQRASVTSTVTGTLAADRHDHPNEIPDAPPTARVHAIAAEPRFAKAAIPVMTLPRDAGTPRGLPAPGRIEAHLHSVSRQVTGDVSALLQVFRH